MADDKNNVAATWWRLPMMHELAKITGTFIPILIALFIKKYPDLFIFFRRPDLFANTLLAITVVHVLLFWLEARYKQKQYYTISRWAWIGFWTFVIYVTGGPHTQFLFLLVIPLLVSVADLDAKATRNAGIFLTLMFGLSIFFIQEDIILEASDIVEHVTRTFLFGVICYYLFITVKETLRQKYEKEKVKAELSEAFELDKLKNSFIEITSHQLRTPLSDAKLGLLSLLDKKEEQKMSDDEKMLKNVHRSVERAIGIINEMLSTAEYGVRRFTATKTTYDANELVSAVVGELTSMARQKNVILHFKSAPVCSPAEGDTRLIKAMLHNVLDNAVRYSPNGEVNVSVSCEGELLHIEVSDTGIGIAKDDIPYIFERFYRGKNALALDPNESGLGLYIAKKVVDIHNGDIIVSSEAGKGTIVKIRLPLQKTKV